MLITLKKIIINLLYVILIHIIVLITISKNLLANNLLVEKKYYLDRSIYSAGAKDMPQILSEKDLQTYYSINVAQEKGNFILADTLIKQLDNPILVGYFLYLRYSNKKYVSSYIELQSWLAKYNNLPISNVIFTIAKNKFSAKQYTNKLQKPVNTNFYAISIPFYNNHPSYTEKVLDIELPPENPLIFGKLQVNATTRQINRYFKSGNNDAIAKILQKTNAKTILNNYTYYHYATILAKAYFLDGEDAKSIIWAKKVVENRQKEFPEASFTLGLSYYRLQEYEKAMVYFYYLSQSKSLFTTDIVSKGAYWYAKTNFIIGNYDKYIEGLKNASTYIYNFYGLVANEELGIKPYYSFEYVNFEQTSLNRLQENITAKRAFALLQMGLLDWAEQELIFLANDIINRKLIDIDLLEALVYVAQHINMPALSLKLAGARGVYYGLSHLSYPVFLLDLDDDYSVDPALLLAFMRRESQFFSSASSRVGAKGLMQLLPETASFVASKYNLTDTVDYSTLGLYSPKVNVNLGQKYVKTLLDNKEIDNNLIAVLIGFNAGLIKGKPWFADKFRKFHEDPIFFIESIPFYETRAYVKSVLTDYWVYQYKLNIPRTSLILLTRGYQPLYSNISREDVERIKSFNYLEYFENLDSIKQKPINNPYQ